MLGHPFPVPVWIGAASRGSLMMSLTHSDLDSQFDVSSHRAESRYYLDRSAPQARSNFGDGGPDFSIFGNLLTGA
jgi:hypothetical protein